MSADRHRVVGSDPVNHPYKVRCVCGEWCYDFAAHKARMARAERAQDLVDFLAKVKGPLPKATWETGDDLGRMSIEAMERQDQTGSDDD